MNQHKPGEELSPIKREAPRDWYIHFTMFNGHPGKAGPYSLPEAEHRMRSTHWRAGSAPSLVQHSTHKPSWNELQQMQKRRKKSLALRNERVN